MKRLCRHLRTSIFSYNLLNAIGHDSWSMKIWFGVDAPRTVPPKQKRLEMEKNGLLTFFTDNNKYRTADFVQSNNFWVGLRIFAWLRYLRPVKLSRYKMFLCRPIFATESTSALTTTSMQCIWILVRLGKINNETPRHGVAQFVLHEESTISPSVFVRDFTPWQLTFVGCYLRFSHDCHVEQKMLFSWKNKLPASR